MEALYMLQNINEHLNYLNQQVDIAPAGSEEELAAAQYINDTFIDGGIESKIEDFGTPYAAPALRAGTCVAVFVGVLLTGIPVSACKFIGAIILFAAIALLILDYLHNPVFEKMSPKTSSQNVIGKYTGQGQYAGRATRPIIIVAHYDTPHTSYVASKNMQSHLDLATKTLIYSIPTVLVLAFIYILFPISEAARLAFWIVSLIASVPALAMGIIDLIDFFGDYTEGANDNKSSLAAMFGVLDHLKNPNLVKNDEEETPVESENAQAPIEYEEVVEEHYETPEVEGVRHGEKVINALGILPADCEITYIDPEPVLVSTKKVVEKIQENASDLENTDVLNGEEVLDVAEEPIQTEEVYDAQLADTYEAETDVFDVIDDTVVEDADNTTQQVFNIDEYDIEDNSDALDAEYEIIEDEDDEPVVEDEVIEEEVEELPVEDIDNDMEATKPLVLVDEDVVNTAEDSIEPEAEDDMGATNPMNLVVPQVEENTPESDSWGRSSYEPSMNKFAQRAALFDLPDPRDEKSIFDTNSGSPLEVVDTEVKKQPVVVPPVIKNEEVATPAVFETQEAAVPPVTTINNVDVIKPLDTISKADSNEGKKKKKHHLFGRKKKKENEESMSEWLGVDENYDAKRGGRQIGSWDNFDDESVDWKGGATSGSQFTVIDGNNSDGEVASAPTEDEMREAILSMVDDSTEEIKDTFVLDEKFLGHDIWFVALGSSAADHAGMKSFLVNHRRDCRGAFLVNLDCIGAGNLTLLAEEGGHNRRRVDRRVGRLLSATAADLNMSLTKEPYLMKDTDATPAMRTSLRSATIMGMENGAKALSGTSDDIIENLDARQIDDVSQLIIEMIRRS